MDKPFIFGVPVEDSHFIGREEEIKRLSTNFKYGVNTILISPRRWGKTSLVNKVAVGQPPLHSLLEAGNEDGCVLLP